MSRGRSRDHRVPTVLIRVLLRLGFAAPLLPVLMVLDFAVPLCPVASHCLALPHSLALRAVPEARVTLLPERYMSKDEPKLYIVCKSESTGMGTATCG